MADTADDKMKQLEEATRQLEGILNSETDNWNKVVGSLTGKLKGNIRTMPDLEAETINYKQITLEEIRKYSLMMSKEVSNQKALVKKRFEFYSTKYEIALKSGSDKMRMVEADLNKLQYRVDLLDSHIRFLRDTSDNLKQLGYGVKNRLELLNILGLD